jgi:hypothetical protein
VCVAVLSRRWRLRAIAQYGSRLHSDGENGEHREKHRRPHGVFRERERDHGRDA